jgi:O-antigen/teichoic acid export membrane protein
MSSVRAHMKSFIAELTVALLSAFVMFAGIIGVARQLGIHNAATVMLAVAFVFPFSAFILLFKTMFPHTVKHRSYSLIAYITLAQLLAAIFTAMLLEAMGECFDCPGNIHDVAFYGIALGTPYGLLYAFCSKLFSVDVDTYEQGV